MDESPEDDWFSEPDARPSPGRVWQPVEDEWLEDEDLPPRAATALDPGALVAPRVLVAAGVFVAFLLAVLAAAGVFSSGAPRTTAPIITTTAPPATPPTTTRPATGPPATTLKPGDTGAQVKVLQRALSSLGYSARALDGQYGPRYQAGRRRLPRCPRPHRRWHRRPQDAAGAHARAWPLISEGALPRARAARAQALVADAGARCR